MIYFIIGYIAFFILIFEFSHYMVFGWIIPEKKLDIFFTKNIEGYEEMDDDQDMFYGTQDLPYVSSSCKSVFSKWHFGSIKGKIKHTNIPRWSKWHKKLNELQDKWKSEHKHKFLDILKD